MSPFAALAGLLLAAPHAPVPAAFAGIPHVRIVERRIAGATIAEVGAALEASADHPPQGGSSYAHTRSDIDWHWQGRGRPCRVLRVDMTVGFVVTLPVLATPDALDEATRMRWRRFVEAAERHEADHARIALRAVPGIRRAILASGCDGADRAGRTAVDALDRVQLDYDRSNRFGAAQGAHFP